MTLTVTDRIEIQELLTQYCYAVDDKDWARFLSLFTETAILDFSAYGGPVCGAREMAEFLRDMAAGVKGWQHTISTNWLVPDGEKVFSRVAAQVMVISKETSEVSFTGLWYRDVIVRTGSGWKIEKRVQEYGWVHNMPGGA